MSKQLRQSERIICFLYKAIGKDFHDAIKKVARTKSQVCKGEIFSEIIFLTVYYFLNKRLFI